MDQDGREYLKAFVNKLKEMEIGRIEITFKKYQSVGDLAPGDIALIEKAKLLAKSAYAPYSKFRVSAVACMSDGSFIEGTNQENASYPIGLCAERVLLAAASSIAPGLSITTMAITYQSDEVDTTAPIAPCGICRQSLLEFESRFGNSMRILLTGTEGLVYEFDSVSALLPLGFKAKHLGR
jgi:cytidine deaminase